MKLAGLTWSAVSICFVELLKAGPMVCPLFMLVVVILVIPGMLIIPP